MKKKAKHIIIVAFVLMFLMCCVACSFDDEDVMLETPSNFTATMINGSLLLKYELFSQSGTVYTWVETSIDNGETWQTSPNNYKRLASTQEYICKVRVRSEKKFGVAATAIAAPQMPFSEISATGHSLAIDSEGFLWAWGYDSHGQTGNVQRNDSRTPMQLMSGTKFTAVSAGDYHSLAIDENGNIWAWGSNTFGQLGNDSETNTDTPVKIQSGTRFVSISAGSSHSLAIDESGILWAWGYYGYGHSGSIISHIPLQLVTDKKFSAISAGGSHSLAIDESGYLWSFGQNSFGQLGDGTTHFGGTENLVQVKPGTKFASISAGSSHSLAIDSNGGLWAWGHNYYGQLGNNSVEDSNLPVRIKSNTVFTTISASSSHSVAKDSSDNVWVWGDTRYWLVDGESEFFKVPKQILTEIKADKISSNAAIDYDGNIWLFNPNNVYS